MSSSSAVSKPQTAYFQWLAENRKKIQEEHKISAPVEVTKKASELWKALPAAAKKTYEDKYAVAKAAWDKVQEGKKAEQDAKLNPEGSKKKPQTPYFLWFNENRNKISEEHKLTSVTDLGKKASELWKALSEADKKPFEDKYAAAKKEYEEYANSDAGKAILQQQKEAKKELNDVKKAKKEKKDAKAEKKAAKAEAKLAKEDGDADMEEKPEADKADNAEKADKADNCPPQKPKREPKAAAKPKEAKEPKADAAEKPSKKRGSKGDAEEPKPKKVKAPPKPKPRKGTVDELSAEILAKCKAEGKTSNEVAYENILAKLLATPDLEVTEEAGLEALKKHDGNLNQTRTGLRTAAA